MAGYRRVLLKLSGEYFAGEDKTGIDRAVMREIGRVLRKLNAEGYEIGVVIGGGNFWRGRSSEGMDRVAADQIGMLATVMNALAFAACLRALDVPVTVMSAVPVPTLCEPLNPHKARACLERGEIVLFGGGTGSPFFTTDSAAALRGADIQADLMLKATLVDGVYDKDPREHADAKKFDEIGYDEVLTRKLGVMDATAAALCRDNKLPCVVFNLNDPDNIGRILRGERIGTRVE